MAALPIVVYHEHDVPQEFQWLQHEAPQFHNPLGPPAPAPSPSPSYACADEDDHSDVSSGRDSDSDSDEEDPYHPYNVVDTSNKWVHQGDFVYAADDLQDNYLSVAPKYDEDVPYVPPALPDMKENKAYASFLAPEDIAPADTCIDPYVFSDSMHQEHIQAIAPSELTRPASSPTPSSSHYAPRAGPSRRTARRSYRMDTDDEVDAESSDNASEDEYLPSPPMRTRKLPPPSSSASSSRAGTKTPRHSYSPYPSSPASTATADSGSRRPGSRNVQISDQSLPARGSWSKTGPDAYVCPYCGHFQKNKRSPDMERHIRSHFRESVNPQWVCCGVPLEEASKYKVQENVNLWTFNGRVLVGGCHEDFSRMDALKRHWRNKNNSCVGNIKYARADDEE